MAAAAGGAGGEVNIRSLLAPSIDEYFAGKTSLITNVEGGRKEKFIVTDKESCREYFQPKILFDNQIAGAPDGIYTWILKDIPAYGRHLFAIRTLTRQEVGTLHNNLDRYTKKGDVIIAGELKIGVDESGNREFLFNILSGTYSQKLSSGEKTARKAALISFAAEKGIAPAKNIDMTELISAIPNSNLTLSETNAKNYRLFCNPPNNPAKKPRIDDGTAAATGGGGGGGYGYMGGGARRSRKHRKSRRSANRKSRKGRRTLKHGQ